MHAPTLRPTQALEMWRCFARLVRARSPASRKVAATHAGRRGDAGDRLAGHPAPQELALAGLQGTGYAGAGEARHRLDRPALRECPAGELCPPQCLKIPVLC